MSTTTTNFGLTKPELTDAADITAMNSNWDKIDQQLARGRVVTAESTDGIVYTATVEGVTALYTGLEIIIIPNMTSASRLPQININGLGAKRIAMPVNGSNTSATTQPVVIEGGATEDTLKKWLTKDKPVKIRFDGTAWETDIYQQSASNLMGTVPVASGGTGADNATDARSNLNIGHTIKDTPTLLSTKQLTRTGFYIGYLNSNGNTYKSPLSGISITFSHTISIPLFYWNGGTQYVLISGNTWEFTWVLRIESDGNFKLTHLYEPTSTDSAIGVDCTDAVNFYISELTL